MKKIRVGIIGAGGMAACHIPGFRKAGAEVVAVAATSLASAEKCAGKYGVPRAYASADEMLANEKLDAVSVLTPNHAHAHSSSRRSRPLSTSTARIRRP